MIFFLFKILLIGDSSVGKSCILGRFCDNNFNNNFLSTIGVDFKLKNVELEDTIVKLQIWDTAGQERFRNITRSYYRGAHGIIFVYDITNQTSFSNINQFWLKEVERYSSENVYKILVGNKIDKQSDRVVPTEDGKALADSLGIEFVETSAKDSTNINETFEKIARFLKVKRK